MPAISPVHAFRAHGARTLYGRGTQDEAKRYEALLNRERNLYSLDKPTDGEVAIYAGQTFSIKQRTVRLLLGK